MGFVMIARFILVSVVAAESREVETFVTKPLKILVRARCTWSIAGKAGEVITVVTKALMSSGAGQAYSECGSNMSIFRQLTF